MLSSPVHMPHSIRRRQLMSAWVAAGTLAATALLAPLRALAAGKSRGAFEANTPLGALRALGASSPADSRDILIDVAQVAENGAVVPIEVSSRIEGTVAISLIVDKNPFPLAARFEFFSGAQPFVRASLKLGESSVVRVLAQAAGKSYGATREVRVTAGGCGG